MPSALACGPHHGRRVSSRACRGLVKLPPASQSFVQLHDVEQFVGSDVCQLQFGVEELAFGIEHLQIAIDTAKEVCIGYCRAIGQGLHEQCLLDALLAGLTIAHQCIRDLTKRGLNNLAELTSVQPAPQSSRSDKATANGQHERLMRLSFFMAIVVLHSPVACSFPVGGHHRTMPDGSGSAQRYHNPDLAASDFSPASFLTAVTTVARPRLTVLVRGALGAAARSLPTYGRRLVSAGARGKPNSTNALASCLSGMTWP